MVAGTPSLSPLARSLPALIASSCAVVYGAWLAFLSVWRLLSFQLGMDFLIISNSVLWMGRGHLLRDALVGLHPFRNWQEHFAPILFLNAALVPAGDMVALVALVASQAAAVALSGWLVFLLGRIWLRSDAAGCAAALLWLASGRLQMAVIHDYHTLTIVPLFLLLAFWGAAAGRRAWMWAGFAATLLSREDAFLALLGLPLVLFFVERRRREALVMLGVIVAWELVVFKVAFPALAGGYRYAGIYTWLAPSPGALLIRILTEPQALLRLYFEQRRNGPLLRFLSEFGFLPLLSPGGWLAALPAMSVSLLSNASNLTAYAYHYVAPPAAALTIGTLLTLRTLRERLRNPRLAGRLAVAILSFLALYSLVLSKRFGAAPWSDMVSRPEVGFSGAHLERVRRTGALADRIPQGARAEYEPGLYTRYQTRRNAWPYRGRDAINPGTDWLLLDERAAWSMRRSGGDQVPLVRSGAWRVAGTHGAVTLLRRGVGSGPAGPVLVRWVDPYEPRTRIGRRTRNWQLVGDPGRPGWLLQEVRFGAPAGRLQVRLDLEASGITGTVRVELTGADAALLASREIPLAEIRSGVPVALPFENPREGAELALGVHHSGESGLVFSGGRIEWLGETEPAADATGR